MMAGTIRAEEGKEAFFEGNNIKRNSAVSPQAIITLVYTETLGQAPVTYSLGYCRKRKHLKMEDIFGGRKIYD